MNQFQETPREKWKDELQAGLLFLYPLSFAFDFKGEDGGTLAQVVMAVFSVLIFGAISVSGQLNALRPIKGVLSVSAVFIMIGAVMAFLNEVPFDRAIRVVFLFWLLLTGIWTGCVAAGSLRKSSWLFAGVIAGGFLSLFFRYYYATGVTGLELGEMRYQVLSPAISCLLAYICASFCFSRKLSVFSLLATMGTVVVVALSVTRSYIITLAFLFAGVPLLLWRLSASNPHHRVFVLWRRLGIAFAILGIMVGVTMAAYLRPGMIEEWQARIYTHRVVTATGSDVNYITRLAELSGIWDQVSEKTSSLVFGMGLGNTYQWNYDYSGEVASVSTAMVHAFFVPTWAPAHSPFTYALFFGGIPALLWQIWLLGMPLWRGWKMSLRLREIPDERVLRLYLFCMLSLWFYLSQSLTSNPLGERLSAQYVGMVIGMILGFGCILDATPSQHTLKRNVSPKNPRP